MNNSYGATAVFSMLSTDRGGPRKALLCNRSFHYQFGPAENGLLFGGAVRRRDGGEIVSPGEGAVVVEMRLWSKLAAALQAGDSFAVISGGRRIGYGVLMATPRPVPRPPAAARTRARGPARRWSTASLGG